MPEGSPEARRGSPRDQSAHPRIHKRDALWDELFNELIDPAVRDLAWLIGAPSLIEWARAWLSSAWGERRPPERRIAELNELRELSELSDLSAFTPLSHSPAAQHSDAHLLGVIERLRELNRDPAPLLSSLERQRAQHTRVRLGVYVEHLMHFWLTEIIGCDPLLREIQLYEPQERGVRTLGALDVVGALPSASTLDSQNRDDRPRWVHLEIASKFYLEHETLTSDSWLTQARGPNERDSLYKKLDRLRSHQLPLSDHPIARERLLELGIDQIDLRRIWMKGRLFRWAGHTELDLPARPLHSLQGWFERALWVKRDRLPDLTERFGASARALERPKPRWLAPPHHSEIAEAPELSWITLGERADEARGERGASLWYLAPSNAPKFWLMIVPSDWGARS